MTPPAPEPEPKRSRRMIVWLVVAPIVILLLALAGANWKTFHLAYAKHLMSSTDPDKQAKGIRMVLETHICKGMTLGEVRRLLAPTEITRAGHYLPGLQSPMLRYFGMHVVGRYALLLGFDDDYKLRRIHFIPDLPPAYG